VIGTDGGLLETSVSRSYVMLAPGERLELWADFGAYRPGTERTLVSLALDGVTPAGSAGAGAAAQGASLSIVKFKIDRPSPERRRLPERLSTIDRYRLADAVNAAAPRRFQATMQHMGFGINGRTFEMTGIAPDERVKLGNLEAWEFDTPLALAAWA